MIIVKLMDGLGNQMFQYAFGRYLQIVYREPMILETMKLRKGAVRQLGLQYLNIPLVEKKPDDQHCVIANAMLNRVLQIASKSSRVCAEEICHIKMSGHESYRKMISRGFYTSNDSITYYPFEKTRKKIKFVRGYFQSEKYFAPVSEIIRKELLIKNEMDDKKRRDYIERLENTNSVCVHIRRGDYIGNKRYDICKEEYYQKAMEYIIAHVDNPDFYIFSNTQQDLMWIRDNYKLPGRLHYANVGENEFDDLCFMYHCKHHVISNSTFSWWGSYLADQAGNITICPNKWINGEEKQDILRDSWVKM